MSSYRFLTSGVVRLGAVDEEQPVEVLVAMSPLENQDAIFMDQQKRNNQSQVL